MHRVVHKKTKQAPSYSKETDFGQSKNYLCLPSMRGEYPPLAGAMPCMPSLEHVRRESFRINLDECPLSGLGAGRTPAKVIGHQGRGYAEIANRRR